MKKLVSSLLLFCFVGVLYAGDSDVVKRAFAQSAKGNHEQAASIARQSRNPLVHDLVLWREMMSKTGRLTLSKLGKFANPNQPWPHQRKLQKLIEGNLPLGHAETHTLTHFREEGRFRPPSTPRGKLALGMALLKKKPEGYDKQEAINWLRQGWAGSTLSLRYRNSIRKAYGNSLREADHVEKIAHAIHAGKYDTASSLMVLVGSDAKHFLTSWMQMKQQKKNPFTIHKAAPKKYRNHELFLYDLYRYDRKHKRRFSRQWLLKQLPKTLRYPEKWWSMTRYQVNDALKAKDARYAYALASSHSFPADTQHNTSLSDAQWLAGWISLRFLKKPKQAIAHFEAMRKVVKTPISLGRAGYWLGRAHEAAGHKNEAKEWYAYASHFSTTFYGQLAMYKAGKSRIKLPSAGLSGKATSNKLVQAGLLLHQAGQYGYANRFFMQAVENAASPEEAHTILQATKKLNRPDYGVWGAKKLSHRTHHIIPDFYYPQHGMTKDVSGKRITAPELPMIYAITLQESLFNPTVKSGAGARGLMQLMPATAKQVSKQLGLNYSLGNLTKKPRYNVTLGSAYLAEMIENFNGSYLLAIVSYNAGPGNARKWIKANGDPRRLRSTEAIVDWIEMIPYNETRNYVMRVLENLQVYRQLIDGKKLALTKDMQR